MSDYSRISDEDLIKSTSYGSTEAFEELYLRYEEKIMGFLVFKLKKQEIASELFQTIWMKVLRKAHTFKQGKPFSPWLMAVANNQVKDWYKATSNYSRLLKNYTREKELGQNPAGGEIDLSFLKQQSQDVLFLKYVEGFSSKEIAGKLEISESNVRKIASRAIKNIRLHIQNGGSL